MPSDLTPAMTETPADEGEDLTPAMVEGGGVPKTEAKPKGKELSTVGVIKDTAKEAAAVTDLALSIPAALLGVGADLGMRIRRGLFDGNTRRESAESGRRASATMMDVFGTPLHKIMVLAGMGGEPGQEGSTATDTIMQRAAGLIEKGGEWLEKNTGGLLLKEDVQSLAEEALALGGGKWLAKGLEKMTPAALRFEGVKLSPYALERLRQEKMREADPPQAQAEAASRAEESAQVATQKTKLVEPKLLALDPITGSLTEKTPEMGQPLPKATSLDTALEKVESGRQFDMTAEERIAFKGWKDEPLQEPIVDEQGVPFNRLQGGGIDPKLLARMAAVGLGAWAGQHFSDDHDLLSAALGAGAGALLARASPAKAVATIKAFRAPDTRIKINDFADAHEKFTKLAAIDVWGLQKQIEDLVPERGRRETITHAIEAGNLGALNNAKEIQAARIAQDYFEKTGQEASLEGVLRSARDNYVTHLWDWTANNRSLVEQWLDRGQGQGGMSPGSRFAKERTVPTLADGKAQGLTPLTEDISHILGIYGNSMNRAIANSVFLRLLKNEQTPPTSSGGPVRPMNLVMKADEAPHTYVSLNHPQFAGLRVHPDIAPSLKMMFDTSQPGAAMKIASGISDTAKRSAVAYSLFHAKALTDAMIGGSSNPFKAMARLPGIVAGTDAYLQELRKGSASPLVDRAMGGGLQFSLEHTGAGVEDAGAGFYSAMNSLQGFLDKTIPGAGLPIKGLTEINHRVDTLMWARLHAGMKLNMFAEKYQQLIDNSATQAAKGKGKALTPEEASRIAASYTNDLFGGLNWRRVAEDAKTRVGREVGQATLNPGARRIMQLAVFAPDWTISTTRAALQALGKPDFINPTTLAGLHQQYLLRSAAYYMLVGDAINYSMSGHHLWENKDPTMIDMDPQGYRHMQWSKHSMEPIHWLTKPGQQAINKLGMLPKEAADQALGVEYLSAKGRMPPIDNRIKHLAKNFAPIVVQQGAEGKGPAALAGFAGVPIYGSTPEEKAARREELRRKRQEAKRGSR